MKKFLVQLSIFLLPLTVLFLIADKLFSSGLQKCNFLTFGEIAVWDDVINGRVNADVAVYGSSRAVHHFDPAIFGDSLNATVFNLGVDGHGFTLQNLRHKLLLQHNTKPRLIIYSLDLWMMAEKKEFYLYEQLLPYMYYDKTVNNSVRNFDYFSVYDLEMPTFRYYGQSTAITHAVSSLAGLPDPPVRVKGYIADKQSWNEDFDKAKASISYYTITLDSSHIKGFESFIKECRQQNIQLVFVNTPMYFDGQMFATNTEEIMNIYKEFSDKYNIPYYDYLQDSICHNKKYFYNVNHLNATGAELFSRRFASQVKEIYRNDI